MEVCRRNEVIEFSEIDPFLAELLRQIPESTHAEGDAAAQARVYTVPAADEEFENEWKLYIQPELKRLFESATETVAEDLKQLCGNEKAFANRALVIPQAHADAWLNALNQARLVIAARNNFSEGELCDHYRSPIGSRRDLSLFQVNFYGFLQEVLLREFCGVGGDANQ
jgi:hypothetical protein